MICSGVRTASGKRFGANFRVADADDLFGREDRATACSTTAGRAVADADDLSTMIQHYCNQQRRQMEWHESYPVTKTAAGKSSRHRVRS